MPIKTSLTNVPKYRIIHGTNHPDGLILMADDMNKRWRSFKEQQLRGQCELSFVWELPDLNLSSDIAIPLEHAVLECCPARTELKDLLACLFDRFGIRYSVADVTRKLKDMEKNGFLTVDRNPSATPTGRPRTGWDYDGKDYRVYVTRKKAWQQDLL
jgi:hypothetical protein